MPTFFLITNPPPFPNALPKKKKRPPRLKLTSQNLVTSSVSASEASSSLSSVQTCTTPEAKEFLATFSLNLESIINYNTSSIKNGQNGIVKRVSFQFTKGKAKICELVKKQGSSSVKREITMATAIKTTTVENFPYHLFALPIHHELDTISNTLYTRYRKLGDLQTNIPYIRSRILLQDNSVFDYVFHIFDQLTIALNALHNSEFKDKKENFHQGIVHNDIKPDNIFLKENGDIELADFGCSYFKDAKSPQFSTFYFSAPELWTNENFCKKPITNSDKADIWSLGATFIYILNNELITPQEKTHNKFDKNQNYKTWAKNYDQQWTDRVVKLDFIFSKELQCMVDNLLKKIDTISSNEYYDFNQKKKFLEILVFLTLAPVDVRPDTEKLQKIVNIIKLAFYNKEPKNFVSQLLERTSTNSRVNSQPTNGYVSIEHLSMKVFR